MSKTSSIRLIPSSSSAYLVSSDFRQNELLSEHDLTHRRDKHPESEKNIRILSTLLPDEIIYFDRSYDAKQKTHMGVLLLADVSGFTDLCERLTKQGRSGASRITKILNEYIGAMAQEVMSHDGDILKFSGDAFLALWKIKNYQSTMTDVVHAAIDCALGIQKSYGQYKTDVDIILRVKIAVAAGHIIVLVIADSNFIVLGNAMFDAKDIGNICNPGEIIISPTAKLFIESNQYKMEIISDTPFIRILGIDSNWSPSLLSHPYDVFDNYEDRSEAGHYSDSDTSLVDGVSHKELCLGFYVLRPSIDYAVSEDMELFLRKFVTSPVIRAIDMEEPLDNLTEIRHVVIVFINVLTQVYSLRQLEFLLECTYMNVYDMVTATGGCVNKVSMFDKDLMFLVIFGLRGFKHKLQAQQALYCARGIRDFLVTNKKVVSASVGVTMGATYCGVVGHPMRKEYTVIGRTVNKAARLMIAYPGMVTCDRQTFLESQLQSRYFTLQPTRPLKGFSNVGAIYKFDDDCSEEFIIEREWLQTNTYPILDRPRELELFFGLLSIKLPGHSAISLMNRQLSIHENVYKKHKLANNKVNMIMIHGAARAGKTRILNEIVYYIRSEIPHYQCTLDKNARKYKIIRCILCEGCKIANVKDLNTRTKYVWRILSPFKVPEFLCALNDMLYVNFEFTAQYERLNTREKLYVKRKMVKYLSRKIFKTTSLITIDNMENLESESWMFYREIIDCGNTFTCATISTNASLPEESKCITEAKDTISIKLLPIHEWYIGALICQFLNVRGISLELEKYVQAHSNGNPGWVESFLTTLRHSTYLKKLDLMKSQAFECGYVLPDINLLKRQDKRKNKISSSNIIHMTSSSELNVLEEEFEGWDMYQQILPIPDDYDNFSEHIIVCSLTKKDGLQEIDTEEYVDLSMLHTYDSLNVLEQHVLKCSSILGEQFTRQILEYVIQSNYDKKTAIAIQRLFEMNVFRCLRATYNKGDIRVKHYVTDPHLDKEAKCECEGFPNELQFNDLPKYANCNYICFREPEFREMCMNLLTETQANLYHIRAIWFLETETRRCYSCGRGYFVKVFGQANDDGMRKYSLEVLDPALIKQDKNVNETQPRSTGSADLYSDYDIIKEIAKLKNYRGAITAKTYENNNLVDCRCIEILINMYTELIEHNQEIGRYEALLNTMLEYAELSNRRNNDSITFTLIAKATSLVEEKLQYIYTEPSWQIPLVRGRILTLLGRLHINRFDYDQAEKCLLSALNAYNLKFPKSRLAVKVATEYHKYRSKISFKYFPNKYIGSNDGNVRMLAEQTADTLCALQTIYIYTQQHDKAYLASMWGLIEALRSNSNFYLNCIAFRNVLRMELMYPRPNIIMRIEHMALDMCDRKFTRLEPHEFTGVIKMYTTIFLRVGIMENLLTAIRLGGIIMNINSPKYGGFHSLRICVFFVRFMIFTYNIKRLVEIMHELLENVALPSLDGLVPQPIRIYVMAMQFMLLTTYSIIPLKVCKSFFTIKIEPSSPHALSFIEMSYYTTIWLWHIRKMEWQESVNIYNRISDTENWPAMKDPDVCYSISKIVEGLLLLYVNKIDNNDTERLPDVHKFLKYAMGLFEKLTKVVLILRSRYYLLKAHYYMIHRDKIEAENYLKKAELHSINFCNFYGMDWVKHNRNAWNNWPKTAINDKWLKSAQTEKVIKSWNNFDRKKLPMFTLRLPLLN